jgi:hypothetical protein
MPLLDHTTRKALPGLAGKTKATYFSPVLEINTIKPMAMFVFIIKPDHLAGEILQQTRR